MKTKQLSQKITTRLPTPVLDNTSPFGANSVGTNNIQPLAVTTPKLADDSVTYDKVEESAVNGILKQYKNYVINSDFDHWQRATSAVVSGNGYVADRWTRITNTSGGTCTISRQLHTLGTLSGINPLEGEPEYFLRYAQSVATTGGSVESIRHKIEGVQTLAGKQVTLSFWAKADAARTVTVNIQQDFGTGGSPGAFTATTVSSYNLTTSWQRFTGTITLPSASGKGIGTDNNDQVVLNFILPLNTTYTIDLSRVSLTEGDVDVMWQRSAPNLAAELLQCKRYYEQFGGSYFWPQIAFGANTIDFQIQFIEKRVNPTVAMVGTVNTDYVITNQNGGGTQTGFGTFTFSGITRQGVDITAPKTAHGLTQSTLRLFATGFVTIDAEFA